MKKITSRVIAVFFAIVLAVSAMSIAASAEGVASYKVSLSEGKTDILAGLTPTYHSFYIKDGSSSVISKNVEVGGKIKSELYTDGIYAYDPDSTKAYRADAVGYWANNTAAAESADANPILSFNGVSKKYLYGIEYKELNAANVTGFALYFNSISKAAIAYGSFDKKFDILVSTDGGTTYQVAWSSKEASNASKANGGDWNEVLGETYNYAYIAEDFSKAYDNVTNIVYACIAHKTNASLTYLFSSFSEIDVYSTAKKADNTGDTSMIVAMILAGAVALTGSVVVIRKRKEDC